VAGVATGRTQIFYGWWIVAAGFGAQALSGALLFHAFNSYVVLLQDEFGWSRTSLALAFAMQRVESGLLGPVQGWMIDTFGPRRVMAVGMLIFGVGFMMFSQVNSLPSFYLAFLLIAVGSSLGTHFGSTVAIVHWFKRKRTLALALMMLGLSAGGLAQPAVVLGLEGLGWRTMALVSGVLIIAVGVPLVSLVRHRPEDHGWTVDGLPPDTEPEGVVNQAAGRLARLGGEIHFTARQALRTRAFWFMAIGHGAATLVIGAVFVHFQAYANESLGYSLTAGAVVILVMTVATATGQMIGGFAADRMNKRLLIVIAMTGHATGLLILAFATAFWMLIAFGVVLGLSWGVRQPSMQALRADYFGGQYFGTIMGFSSLVIMFGMILGPIIAGLSYDITGSYRSGFTLLATCAAFGSIFWWLAVPPDPPDDDAAEPDESRTLDLASDGGR
jgi:MFS family permease